MSYSKDYRKRTIEYRQEGHTLEETHQTFKVAISTIQRWEEQLKETGDKILAPFEYSGTMDNSLFEFWFSNQFLPSLDKGSVIVMDNASFHSKRRLISAAQKAGCKLLFLPPYSPELNPIEKIWAWLKRFLRKILPFSSAFDDALFAAFQLW